MGVKNRSNPKKPSFISQIPFSSLSKKSVHTFCAQTKKSYKFKFVTP